MRPGVRNVLKYLPVALQLAALAGAIGIVSFITPVTQQFIHDTEGKVVIPAPTRLLVENAGAAKVIFVALFLLSALSMILTRAKMKEDADRLIVQSAVISIVWYLGIIILGAIVMAALLPYVPLAAAPP